MRETDERLPGYSHRDHYHEYQMRERAIRKAKGLPDLGARPPRRASNGRDEIRKRRTARGAWFAVARVLLLLTLGGYAPMIIKRLVGG